jgi:hypothetical protein
MTATTRVSIVQPERQSLRLDALPTAEAQGSKPIAIQPDDSYIYERNSADRVRQRIMHGSRPRRGC